MIESANGEGGSGCWRRLVKGLLPGGAAVGLPALANALIEKHSVKLGSPAWGRHARNPPIETADLWLLYLPLAVLSVFEECGNLPHLEASARFSQSLESLVSRFPG
jgi:hypothetical protein